MCSDSPDTFWEEHPCFASQGGRMNLLILSFQEIARSDIKTEYMF